MTRFEPDLFYDTVENVFTKPGDPDFDKRAESVNSVDEVMDGAWFTNRAGTRRLTAGGRGARREHGSWPGAWPVDGRLGEERRRDAGVHDSRREQRSLVPEVRSRRAIEA